MRTPLFAAALALISTIGFAHGASADAAFGPVPVTPGARNFHLGALELTSLHDARFVVPNDGKTFGLGTGTSAVASVLHTARLPTDRITLGVNPDTVTDVLITHPHLDHIGGLTDSGGSLAFPNATIRMSSAAWAWLKKGAPPALIKALTPRVRTFTPGARVAPGITSIALPGHTPGHVGYEIVSGSARLLDIGDVVHSSVISLAEPLWAVQFDSDPVLARATRLKTLMSLSKSHEWVFAPHFPFPGVGHIVAADRAFAWMPEIPDSVSRTQKQ